MTRQPQPLQNQSENSVSPVKNSVKKSERKLSQKSSEIPVKKSKSENFNLEEEQKVGHLVKNVVVENVVKRVESKSEKQLENETRKKAAGKTVEESKQRQV